MKTIQSVLLVVTLGCTLLACAQNTLVFEAQADSCQIDHEKKIIIVNIDAEEGIAHENEITSVTLERNTHPYTHLPSQKRVQ